jgi:hypothetical protein
MTANVSRLAGAILLERDGEFFLIGNTKTPCDWNAEGFVAPAEVDAIKQPVLPIASNDNSTPVSPILTVRDSELSSEAIAQILANRFLIRRNGSVSERLWRIIIGENDESTATPELPIRVDWLISMPSHVWEIVRETALKCL